MERTPQEAVEEARRLLRTRGTEVVEVGEPEAVLRLDDPAASGYAVPCWIYVMDREDT